METNNKFDSQIEEQQHAFNIGKELLAWEAPEYFHYDRTNDWYWWTGLVAILLIAFALWQGSFLFAILILVGWFTVVLYAIRPPQIVICKLTEKGVLVKSPHSDGIKMYPWAELKSYWIFYRPPIHAELSIISKKTLMTHIKLPLGEVSPDKVKNIVKQYLAEEEQKESLIDNLSQLAKF